MIWVGAPDWRGKTLASFFWREREREVAREKMKHSERKGLREIGKLASKCRWEPVPKNLTNCLTAGVVSVHSPPPCTLPHGSKSPSLRFSLCSLTLSPAVYSGYPSVLLLSNSRGGGGKTFKGSCHSMLCWTAQPPGGFAWREERTSTSPWPSPGWVSDEDVSIMRTHDYRSFF